MLTSWHYARSLKNPAERPNSLALRARDGRFSAQELARRERPRALFAPFQALAASLPYRAALFSDHLFLFERFQRQAVFVREDFARTDGQGDVIAAVDRQHFGRDTALADLS